MIQIDELTKNPLVLPSWFRQELPDMAKVHRMQAMFRQVNLHTVCESAHCPNMGQCWGRGVATFMILGDICTRACRFCAVPAGQAMAVDSQEPTKIAQAVAQLQLRYVVVTSVARDDLNDEGAGHFVQTIREIRRINPYTKIEILIPDFSGKKELLETVAQEKPEVISHNIETVRRLSAKIRPQADYGRSLQTLAILKNCCSSTLTKSSLMVGLGETLDELKTTMQELICVGCDMLTIGQYLSPSLAKRHVRVERFVSPEEFQSLKEVGLQLGFRHVMSGPLVRSSYIAEEGYRQCLENFIGTDERGP